MRVLRPGGWALVGFHLQAPDVPPGGADELRDLLSRPVRLRGYAPAAKAVERQARAAGFSVAASIERDPLPQREFPSRRCMLLLRRDRNR